MGKISQIIRNDTSGKVDVGRRTCNPGGFVRSRENQAFFPVRELTLILFRI